MMAKLTPEQLRKTFSIEELPFQTTQNLKKSPGIVGQKRAVSALNFGLDIQAHGFNVYVAGPQGIGKMTAIQSFLEEMVHHKSTPEDWCYVNNFDTPDQPHKLALPAGRGRQLQHHMKKLIDNIRSELPKSFESEEYNTQRDAIIKTSSKERDRIISQLNERARQDNLILQSTPYGLLIIPIKEGRPLPEEVFQTLPESERQAIQERRQALEEEAKRALKRIHMLEQKIQEQLEDLDRRGATFVVGIWIDDLLENYRDLPEVVSYFQAVQKDIVDNIAQFKTSNAVAEPPPQPQLSPENGLSAPWLKDLPFRKYQVNLLIDNSEQKGAPIVVEHNPTYLNLFGRIEKETHYGTLYTDFTMIKAGALHQANGGYLILPVEDLLRNAFSWTSLKRALRSHEVQIEEPSELMGFYTVKSLRPKPIPLDVKVILVGRSMLYYLLYKYDEDFPELFRVKADFDTEMNFTQENMEAFLGFLCGFCEKEKIRHLDKEAVIALLEFSSRLAEDQEKLSTHFGILSDVLREANFWAIQDQSEYIRAVHIKKTLDERIYRSGLIQEHIQESIERGLFLIDTSGEVVGQLNGLSVMRVGDYFFGKPNRITVSVSPGRGGIVDIEREAKLGGALHSKGVMILTGFLMNKFAKDSQLSLSARLVFEQSYSGVDGDSASSTELYAILSALSQAPIQQGIAVTGSVNQQGEIQAIGGVNQKIEGFFDICKLRGLTGKQGVIIPQSNVKHLMLRDDVIQSVKENLFHIWAISSIDEGIEILTGIEAGKPDKKGHFPKKSIYGHIEKRLEQFSEHLKQSSKPQAKKESKSKSKSQKSPISKEMTNKKKFL